MNANYDLRALIADVTEVVRDTQDDDARCERITPYLRKWMDGGAELPERYTQPCDGRACGHNFTVEQAIGRTRRDHQTRNGSRRR